MTTDSLSGHHPRAAERVYCEECGHLFPCPGYLAQPAVLPGQPATTQVSRDLVLRLCKEIGGDDPDNPGGWDDFATELAEVLAAAL